MLGAIAQAARAAGKGGWQKPRLIKNQEPDCTGNAVGLSDQAELRGSRMANEKPKLLSRQEAINLNLPKYYTGEPCRRGHLAERRVSNASCGECESMNSKAWHKNNPEKAKEKERKWRFKNIEKYRAQRSAWNRANPEIGRESARKIRARRRTKIAMVVAKPAPRPETPERVSRRAYESKWRSENRERIRVQKRNREANKRGNGGAHSLEDVLDIIKSQKGKCAYCRSRLTMSYHVDHIIPLVSGGANGRRNLQVLCEPCNLRKNKKDPIDYARSQGFLL